MKRVSNSPKVAQTRRDLMRVLPCVTVTWAASPCLNWKTHRLALTWPVESSQPTVGPLVIRVPACELGPLPWASSGAWEVVAIRARGMLRPFIHCLQLPASSQAEPLFITDGWPSVFTFGPQSQRNSVAC